MTSRLDPIEKAPRWQRVFACFLGVPALLVWVMLVYDYFFDKTVFHHNVDATLFTTLPIGIYCFLCVAWTGRLPAWCTRGWRALRDKPRSSDTSPD